MVSDYKSWGHSIVSRFPKVSWFRGIGIPAQKFDTVIRKHRDPTKFQVGTNNNQATQLLMGANCSTSLNRKK